MAVSNADSRQSLFTVKYNSLDEILNEKYRIGDDFEDFLQYSDKILTSILTNDIIKTENTFDKIRIIKKGGVRFE